jgi:succinate dehydrogenase/fumarate reductase flavoprotein subunit
MDPTTLEFWKQLLGALAALVTLIVAVLGWLKSRRAAGFAEDAAASSRQAADQSSGASMNSAETSDALADFKKRFDDVYAALIEERLQEKRMRQVEDEQAEVLKNQRRILEFMAELEQERHTTGNIAAFQQAARDRSSIQ